MAKLAGSDRTNVTATGGYWHDPTLEFSGAWSDGSTFFRVTGGGDFTPGAALVSNNNGSQWDMAAGFTLGIPQIWTGTAGGIGYAFKPDYFVWFVGNSITAQGASAGISDSDHYTTRALAGLDPDVWHAYIYGVPGQPVSGMTGQPVAAGIAPAGQNIAVLFEIRNSLSQGVSVADTYQYVQDWCAHVQGLGYKAVVLTCKPDPDVDETKRGQINDLIRANWPDFCDAILDLDTVPEALADSSIHFDASVHSAIGAALQPVLLSVVGLGGTIDSISVSPASVTLYGGQTQQFTATIESTGSVSEAVTWSMTGTGSLNGSGLYTAPGGLASGAQSATITATSVQDGTKTDSATVTIPAHGAAGGDFSITIRATAS